MKTILKLLLIAIGIIVSFTIHGFLLEKITKTRYAGKKFTFFQTLVGLSTLCYSALAGVGVAFEKYKENKNIIQKNNNLCDTKTTEVEGDAKENKMLYLCASVSYVLASLASTASLLYIPYIVQIIAKSTKPIPALIFTTIIGKSRYSWKKYAIVIMLVSGVGLVLYKEKAHKVANVVWYGEILILISLIFDGVCNGFEEKIRNRKQETSPFSLMFAMNFTSSIIICTSAVISTEVFNFLEFVQENPVVLKFMAFNILAGSFGQIFIFWMIVKFGALPCTIVTTVRKCITVLISLFYFGNSLEIYQWIGSSIVFLSLFADIVLSNFEFQEKDKENEQKMLKEQIVEQHKSLPV